MADDLVASLTLELRNEMDGGIDAIKAEFGGLGETLAGIRDALGELSGVLAELRAPTGLSDGMAGVASETSSAITEVEKLGIAIDEDAAKLREMYAAAGQWGQFGIAPAAVDAGDPNRPAFIPPGYGGGGDEPPRPAEPPRPDEPPRPRENGFYGGAGDVGTHLVMAGVEASLADDAAKQYAEFSSVLYQTAIKEGFGPDKAQAEVQRLTSMIDSLALETGGSSQELAEAYYWLVTTGMNKALINQVMPSLAKDATAYNNDPIEDAQSVYSLNGVLGVPADQIGRALSILSVAASKEGHFSISDFGNYLPGLASGLDLLGDTGIKGETDIAAALEASRKDAGTSEVDAIDLQDLISYLASPIAGRFFDRTQRSKDLLGKGTLDLFKKYHIPDIDIPAYLDAKEAKGEDAFDSMMDLAAWINQELPASATGTDRETIYRSLFHNQQAASAAMAISQNYGVFKADENQLMSVGDGQVQTDFKTAIGSPTGQLNIYQETLVQLERELGQDVLPSLVALGIAAHLAFEALNEIGTLYSNYFAKPVGEAIGTQAAYVAHEFAQHPNGAQRSRFGYNEPMQIHIKVDGAGNVISASGNSPPGTSVRVNQGQVLGAP
jgi:hypothetical protein